MITIESIIWLLDSSSVAGVLAVTYRHAWAWCIGLVAAAGCGASLMLLSATAVLTYLVVGAVTGAVVATGLHDNSRARDWRWIVRVAGWSGAGFLASVAAMTLSVGLALAGLVLVALSAPPAIDWLRGRQRARRAVRIAAKALPDIASPPSRLLDRPEQMASGLTTETLCALWRDSALWLSVVTSPRDVLRVSLLRCFVIDELERRHPDGVAAWLEAEELADSDPQRFVD